MTNKFLTQNFVLNQAPSTILSALVGVSSYNRERERERERERAALLIDSSTDRFFDVEKFYSLINIKAIAI